MLKSGELASATLGQGEDLVLLHGWGMSSRFMRPFAEGLAEHFRVTLIDLPGHGESGLIAELSARGIARAVRGVVPGRAHWLGWSLGGMIALEVAAIAPDAVRSLVLLAATPRFVSAAGWPGVEPSVLRRFATDLHGHYDRTIDRFLALQLHGMEGERGLLKILRATLAGQRPPDEAALSAGLRILMDVDLRSVAVALRCPSLVLLGRRDRLVPAEVGAFFSALAPDAEVQVLEGAAHIPFWTHADMTRAVIESFLARTLARRQ